MPSNVSQVFDDRYESVSSKKKSFERRPEIAKREILIIRRVAPTRWTQDRWVVLNEDILSNI